MRAFVFLFFSVAAYAAPQAGFNYQLQADTSLKDEFAQNQFKLLQLYAQQQFHQQQQQQQQQQQHQQQQQPKLQLQLLELPQQSVALSQALSQEANNIAGGFHIKNQLPQLAHYEHEQQLQQQQHTQVQPKQQQQQHQTLKTPQQQPLDLTQQQPSQTLEHHAHTEAPKYPQPQQFQKLGQIKPEASQIETVAAPLPQSQPQEQHFEARHQTVVPQFQQSKQTQYHNDFEQSKDLDEQLNNIQKNITLLFIRALENNQIANAALQLAKQSLNQHNVVYGSNKQHDAADLDNELHQNQIRAGSSSKPDIAFIKYRKPQEAEQTQRNIQAQYDALDGQNHFNHEVVGTTHNFIGYNGGLHIDLPKQSSKIAEALEAARTPKYFA